MQKFWHKNFLSFLVFSTGAAILIIEIVAIRALSPYFGNTIFTVSSVISTILLALSVGYYTGGKLADKRPSFILFYNIILLGGLLLLGLYFAGTVLLPTFGSILPLSTGPLVAALFLYLLPSLLLGMISPFAVKLQQIQTPEQGLGSIAGTIFFWSTLGSISGSILAGFVLIPNFGIDLIFTGTSSFIIFLGAAPLGVVYLKKKPLYNLILLILVFVGGALVYLTHFVGQAVKKQHLYHEDGIYEQISVYDGVSDERPVRYFQQDRSISGMMYLDTEDPTELATEYTRYYALHRLFVPDLKKALIIGGGIFSVPRALLAEDPDVEVHVSEIEPRLVEVAQNFFELEDDPRLEIFLEDGRRMLQDSEVEYDFVFSDVYYSYFSVPSHFTTQEFYSMAKDRLSDQGVFVANFIGSLSRTSPSLIMASIKTFQSVFPNSYFFAIEDPGENYIQNIIFVGSKSDQAIDFASVDSFDQFSDPILQDLPKKWIDLNRFSFKETPLLTDNYAPVDYLSAWQLLRNTPDKETEIQGRQMLGLIDQQTQYGPRTLGSEASRKMQTFLVSEMKTFLEDVQVQTWKQEAPDRTLYPLTNIIGRLHPERKDRIILGTHYDTIDIDGANDGASGVAVLLEIARTLSKDGFPSRFGIDFIFFDGEEGFPNTSQEDWLPIGSTYLAQNLDTLYPDQKPEQALILDMVCDKNLTLYQEVSSTQNAPELVNRYWSIGEASFPKIFRSETKYEIRDDHTPLIAAGIPSFLVIDFDYPFFHTPRDTLKRCGAKSLEAVARTTLEYLRSLR